MKPCARWRGDEHGAEHGAEHGTFGGQGAGGSREAPAWVG